MGRGKREGCLPKEDLQQRVESSALGLGWSGQTHRRVRATGDEALCSVRSSEPIMGTLGVAMRRVGAPWGCPKDAPALYVSGWKEDGFYRDNLGWPKRRSPELLKDTLVPLLKHSHHVQHFPAGLGEVGEDVFLGLSVSTFPSNTHQGWCFKGKVPARSLEISIQSLLVGLGTFPITTAKMSKPKTSSTTSLIIHRPML